MAHHIDNSGENPHINYEPNTEGGLHEAPNSEHDYRQPVQGALMRRAILRTQDDYKQVGERYRTFENAERDELVNNIGNSKTVRRKFRCE